MELIILLCIVDMVFGSLVRESWLNFKSKYGKLYQNIEEQKRRYSIFKKNLHAIEEHNKKYEAGETTYFKGVNQFTDLTKEEFISLLKRRSAGRQKREIYPIHKESIGGDLPSFVDWRAQGAVSKVKDQGDCGSCSAFSVTETLESFNYLKYKKMVMFSKQQLVDCVKVNHGCGGGFENNSLAYVKTYGIESEESYPYVARDQICNYIKDSVVAKIQGYIPTEPKNEYSLKLAVGLKGPTFVALDASNLSNYAGGIFTDQYCGKEYFELNHAVLAVGYGKDAKTGLNYWLIKNSWSEDWGEDGYFKIKRGSNECGIATDGLYPVF